MEPVPTKDPGIDQYSIKLLEHGKEDLWDAFVGSNRGTSLYHQILWQKLIRDVFGRETYYLYAVSESDTVAGILPLVRLKSRFFGDYLVSMPYVNYGGAIALTGDIELALMKQACQLAEDLHVSHIEFRDTVRRDDDWRIREDKVIMELALPASDESLWSGFTSKLRAQIKRPLRENIEVVYGRSDLLPEFYQVLTRNMRDLGSPVHSMKLYTSVIDSFPQAATIVLVRHNKIPVAAGFLLGHKDRLEIPWASSVRSANSIGVNMLLYWEALKFAIERGYKVFDFGRSTINSGTYRFKKQWGARERQLYWHYWLREGAVMPELTPSSPKYRFAIKVWQHLPLFVANWLGPKVVKNLP